ncbi:MAG TPA: hypothetical protein VII66_00875, partial [Gemmatimonadaceae bacterium]
VERDIDPAAIETLRDAIGVSGLSIREFAGRVLVRDQRTIRRWLAGDRPIPEIVVGRCREIATQ